MKKCLRRLLAAICICTLLLSSASALSLEQAIDLLEVYYVDDLPEEAYEAQNLDELFLSLNDPYTYYMTASQYQDFNAAVENTTSIVGIGVQISYEKSGIRITKVINGGPAEKAGLKAGDIIVAVNGVSCAPASNSTADLVRGEAGTTVVLTITHTNGQTEEMTLTRASVVVENTNVSMDGHIGRIDCDSFGSTTADLIRAGITSHEQEAEIWWMDLRDNSGGLASVAVEAVGMFSGPDTQLAFRDGSDQYYYSSSLENAITTHPVIVLTNTLSASASELFAADIRDHAAGISVGSRTFGKGVAQIVLNNENTEGYFTDDAMKVTGYRFFSKRSNTTDMIGVIPTILVNDADTEAVARLLSEQVPTNTDGWLRITLSGWYWYVNAAAQKGQDANTLDTLLAALPPDAVIAAGTGQDWFNISTEVAITMFGSNVESRWFNDISSSKYANALNTLATYGLLQGDGSGHFQPNNTLTRAELCALLAQALGIGSLQKPSYSDVSSQSWYAPYVTAMTSIGLVKGFGDGTFHPDDIVSNEQFLTIMARMSTFLNSSLYDVAHTFSDSDLADQRLASFSSWAKNAACLMLYTQTLLEDGSTAIAYDDITTMNPSTPVLREQAAATLYNLLHNTGILCY